MKLGNARNIVIAALAISAAVGVIGPHRGAHAAIGGPFTAVNANMSGSSGDDLFVLARDGNLYTHNRFAAGDPGFESAADWDSTVAGVQTRTVAVDPISCAFFGGDDTFRMVGTFQALPCMNSFGDGNDTLDLENYLSGPGQGAEIDPAGAAPDLENVIGTPFADILSGSNRVDPDPAPVTILAGGGDDTLKGTAHNDVLDGGDGLTTVSGMGGDDTFVVTAPLPATNSLLDDIGGGPGNDTVVFRGASGADDLAVVGPDEQGYAHLIDSADPDGGYKFSVEAMNLDLRGGADQLFAQPIMPTVIDAGDGTDHVTLDANQGTAQVQTVDGGQLFTVPQVQTRRPTGVRIGATAEEVSILNETVLATAVGVGGGPHVRTFRLDGTPVASFFAYGVEFRGGVNVALGDLDGDLDDEIITGAGPGGGPHVRVFRSDGTDTSVSFFAYGADFHGGVNVAAIDLDGDGIKEIITVPASGGGPHVRIWSGDGELYDEWMADGFGSTGLFVAAGPTSEGERILLGSSLGDASTDVFEADGTPTDGFLHDQPYGGFTGGLTVAGGDFLPTGNFQGYNASIVTGAGLGGGPHVKVSRRGGTSDGEPLPYVVEGSFLAYGADFHGGVSVATCDPDGDQDEIVTGPGPGGGPHVRMFTVTGSPLALSFFAYDPGFGGGVHVACGGAETKSY